MLLPNLTASRLWTGFRFCFAKSQQAWQESNLQRTVLETVALPIGATGLSNLAPFPLLSLLCFFMQHALAAKRTKFLQFQTLWFLFLVFGAVIVNAIANGALKMNCLAHIC